MIMLSLVGPETINKIIIASYIPQRIKIMDLFQFLLSVLLNRTGVSDRRAMAARMRIDCSDM